MVLPLNQNTLVTLINMFPKQPKLIHINPTLSEEITRKLGRQTRHDSLITLETLLTQKSPNCDYDALMCRAVKDKGLSRRENFGCRFSRIMVPFTEQCCSLMQRMRSRNSTRCDADLPQLRLRFQSTFSSRALHHNHYIQILTVHLGLQGSCSLWF